MKRTWIILGILALLLLSGCRPVVPNVSASPNPTPSASVKPTKSPPPVTTPLPTDPAPPETPPPGLTAEELASLARGWYDEYAGRFAGYEALRIPLRYWFGDYFGGATQVPFTAADGADGTVYFLAEAQSPAEAAAQLLNQPVDKLILVDRARQVEELSQRLSAMAGENLTEEAALDLFLKNAPYTPALTENTWYCVNTDDTGYLLMYSGAYRIQRLAALSDYAKDPVLRVRIAFEKAARAAGWFYHGPLPLDKETKADRGDGRDWYRVDYPEISSMLELRTYLKTIFSDEIVDALLSKGLYADVDGVLYGLDFPAAVSAAMPAATVTKESPTRVVYRMGDLGFDYELVGDRWLFTEFPLFG